MKNLNSAQNIVAKTNDFLGRSLSWLAGFMALTVFSVVILRTFFSSGSVAAQESVTYMHAALFLLCLAYTAQHDGHVRVDIIYRKWGPTAQNWANLMGCIAFLLPFSVFLTLSSLKFAQASWSIGESSINPGGIPAVFLLKTLIPVSGVLLFFHCVTEIVRCLLKISFVPNSHSTL